LNCQICAGDWIARRQRNDLCGSDEARDNRLYHRLNLTAALTIRLAATDFKVLFNRRPSNAA